MTTSENVTVVDGYTLANAFERVIAFILDGVVYAILYVALYNLLKLVGIAWLGAAIALLYLLFRDSFKLLNHQSLGKKVMKLKVIRSNEGMKVSYFESLKRNFLFVPNLVYAFDNSFIYAAATLTFILVLIDLYYMFTSSDNQRLGDQYADTIVIENSI